MPTQLVNRLANKFWDFGAKKPHQTRAVTIMIIFPLLGMLYIERLQKTQTFALIQSGIVIIQFCKTKIPEQYPQIKVVKLVL